MRCRPKLVVSFTRETTVLYIILHTSTQNIEGNYICVFREIQEHSQLFTLINLLDF